MLSLLTGRGALIVTALATLALFASLAIWLTMRIDAAQTRGHAEGLLACQAAARAQADRVAAAAQAARVQTDRDVAALERSRVQLQERLDDLAARLAGARDGDRACLGPDLLRALDAIRPGAPRAGPRP